MSTNQPHETRSRILEAATEVFAEKGFAKASTREIASRANANIASLHYHFGDKAGLYRAVFANHFKQNDSGAHLIDFETASFIKIYNEFNWQFFIGAAGYHFPRLLARERWEPSGLLGEDWLAETRHLHEALNKALARELGLAAPDTEIKRLGFMLIGMAVVFDHARPMIELSAPELISGPDWVDTTLARLAAGAQALIDSERKRRGTKGRDDAPCLL